VPLYGRIAIGVIKESAKTTAFRRLYLTGSYEQATSGTNYSAYLASELVSNSNSGDVVRVEKNVIIDYKILSVGLQYRLVNAATGMYWGIGAGASQINTELSNVTELENNLEIDNQNDGVFSDLVAPYIDLEMGARGFPGSSRIGLFFGIKYTFLNKLEYKDNPKIYFDSSARTVYNLPKSVFNFVLGVNYAL